MNRILINAIISFCRDDLAIALNKKVLADSSLSRLKDYTYYLRIAMAAEQRQNAFPTVPLKYSRKLPQSPDSFAALNSITVPDIHPCLHIAPIKNTSSRLVENYFPYHTPDQIDDLNPFVNVNVGPPLMGPHLPLGHGSDEEPAHAYVPHALVIPPAVPAQYYPPVLHQPVVPMRPVPPVVPPIVVQPAVPVQPVPAPVVPAAPVHQPRPAAAEPIYAEVLSMMMQNFTNLSEVPDRGRSRDRQYVPRSRDNSRDRAHNGSGDRYGYRPTARSDQRQSNYYSQRDNYKKPNYSGSNRDRNRDEEQRRRDGSAEAKRLAREGAMKGPYRPRSSTPRDDRNRPRDRTPDRRDISRDRSYETKRQLLQEDAMTKAYPEMKRGMNCSANYNPAIKKNCTKCPLASAHHEFACRKYQRYNQSWALAHFFEVRFPLPTQFFPLDR